MKPFIYLKRPSKVTQGHWICHTLLDHLDFLSDTRKVGYAYLQTRIGEMTLKVNQGNWQWHTAIGHISLSINGLL